MSLGKVNLKWNKHQMIFFCHRNQRQKKLDAWKERHGDAGGGGNWLERLLT